MNFYIFEGKKVSKITLGFDPSKSRNLKIVRMFRLVNNWYENYSISSLFFAQKLTLFFRMEISWVAILALFQNNCKRLSGYFIVRDFNDFRRKWLNVLEWLGQTSDLKSVVRLKDCCTSAEPIPLEGTGKVFAVEKPSGQL